MSGIAGPIPGAAPGEDPWIGRLLDEYKILQDKIDKIGAFRFTIKGWSVTITAASLAAATAANASGWAALLPLVVAWVFLILERSQHELSAIYSARASKIEAAMVGLRSGRIADLRSVAFIPGISNAVWRAGQTGSRLVRWRKVLTDPDYLIYLVQFLVIFAVAALLFVRGAEPPSAKEPGPTTVIFGQAANETGQTSQSAPAGEPGIQPRAGRKDSSQKGARRSR